MKRKLISDMNKAGFHKKENRIYFFLFLLVWCVQMLTAVYFCCQKQGFHEDEFYTYYSTARTYGLMIEDGAWMERDAYYNEFVVQEGQGFQYGLVKLVQSWDVHPPVYYWLFHTVCSFFPGQFSKWFGLGINLAAFGISMFLLRCLSLKVTGNNEALSFFICLFYGFTPAAMSSVVFIRMYALLTVFVYLCAILHMNVVGNDRRSGETLSEKARGEKGKETRKERSADSVREEKKRRTEGLSFGKFLLPLMLVTYFGFLTQYYYFIFLFFLAFAFCIYLLWRDRNLWNCIRYGASLAVSFVLAYLTYPACLGQMFRGQRGAQATDNFFDISNTFERISFFWKLLDEYVFGKMLLPLLALAAIMAVYAAYAVRKRKKEADVRETARWPEIRKGIREKIRNWWENNAAYRMLLFAVLGYFLAVSKTALLLGNTSVRYQTPVYGMAVLLLFGALWNGWQKDSGGKTDRAETGRRSGKKIFRAAAVGILLLLINLPGLFSGRVVFLYPEAAQRVAFAKEKAEEDVPAVCLYDAGQSWCVWDSADEFFEYDRIYFASQNDTEPISDAVIADCGELVVYLSNTAEKEEQLERILNSSPKLAAYELLFQEKYCEVYYFHG